MEALHAPGADRDVRNILAEEAVAAQVDAAGPRDPEGRETIELLAQHETTRAGGGGAVKEATEAVLGGLDLVERGHRVGQGHGAGGRGGRADLLEEGMGGVELAEALDGGVVGVVVHQLGAAVVVGVGGGAQLGREGVSVRGTGRHLERRGG
jgi:hypothetical protein